MSLKIILWVPLAPTAMVLALISIICNKLIFHFHESMKECFPQIPSLSTKHFNNNNKKVNEHIHLGGQTATNTFFLLLNHECFTERRLLTMGKIFVQSCSSIINQPFSSCGSQNSIKIPLGLRATECNVSLMGLSTLLSQ